MTFTDEQIKAFPAWLQKLVKLSPQAREAAGYTDEDLEQAAKAYHLDKDYTQTKQRFAGITKFLEANPDANVEEAWEELNRWRAWGQKDWPEFKRQFSDLQTKAAAPAATNGDGNRATTTKRRWRDAEAADLYETARLREVFEDLENGAVERAVKAVREDWYQKEEVPRLDKMAGGYLQTVVDLVDFAQQEAIKAARDPNYNPLPISDILKEAAARGEKDFRKVATAVGTERGTLKKTGFDEGYAKGIEEGKKAAASPEGPSGPMGGGQPAWRPAPSDQKPKTREERAQAVIATVEKKHGQRLPL